MVPCKQAFAAFTYSERGEKFGPVSAPYDPLVFTKAPHSLWRGKQCRTEPSLDVLSRLEVLS